MKSWFTLDVIFLIIEIFTDKNEMLIKILHSFLNRSIYIIMVSCYNTNPADSQIIMFCIENQVSISLKVKHIWILSIFKDLFSLTWRDTRSNRKSKAWKEWVLPTFSKVCQVWKLAFEILTFIHAQKTVSWLLWEIHNYFSGPLKIF